MLQIFVDDRSAQQRLARLNGRFAKSKHGLDPATIGELERKFIAFAKRQFETQVAAGGQKWDKLAPRTLAMKAARGTLSKGILKDTEEMFRMLTASKHEDRRWERSPNGAKVFFTMQRFRHHQEGTKRMPARPVYPDPLPPSFIQELKNTITGYLLEGEFV